MFFKHGITYFLATLAPALSSFLAVAFYTRWMDTAEYGVYTTVLMVASSINSVMLGWLQAGIMRFWNDKLVSAEAIRNLIGSGVLVTSMLVAVLLLGFALVSGEGQIAWVLVLLFVATALYEAWQRINSITFQTRQYLLAEIARAVLIVGVGLSLVKLGYGWIGAALGVVLGNLLVLLFSGSFWQLLRPQLASIDRVVLKKILVYGIPMSLSAILFGVIQIAERTLIGWFSGYDVVGEYAAAYNPPRQILFMIAGALNMAAYPLIIHALEQQGAAQAASRMRDYIIFYVGVFAACALGLLGIADDFVPILIGAEFVATALQFFPWVIVAVAFHAFYLFYISLFFQINKQTGREVQVILLAAVASVALNVLLLPLYGLAGAAVTAIVTYLLCVVYGYVRGKGSFQVAVPWLEMGKIALAALVMYLLMGQAPDLHNHLYNLLLKIPLGMLVYAGMVWLLDIGGIRHVLKGRLGWLTFSTSSPR